MGCGDSKQGHSPPQAAETESEAKSVEKLPEEDKEPEVPPEKLSLPPPRPAKPVTCLIFAPLQEKKSSDLQTGSKINSNLSSQMESQLGSSADSVSSTDGGSVLESILSVSSESSFNVPNFSSSLPGSKLSDVPFPENSQINSAMSLGSAIKPLPSKSSKHDSTVAGKESSSKTVKSKMDTKAASKVDAAKSTNVTETFKSTSTVSSKADSKIKNAGKSLDKPGSKASSKTGAKVPSTSQISK